MTVGTYVLAAGQGKRFGAPKLDVLCAGRPLGSWIIAAIHDAGVAPGVIIVPPVIPRFAVEARLRGWTLTINPESGRGLSTSVACAIEQARAEAQSAACIFLADMPLVSPRHVQSIVAAGHMDRPVATLHPGGKPGVPARFPRNLFSAIASDASDGGAAALLAKLPVLRAMTDFADLQDVDSPADLARVEAVLAARGTGSVVDIEPPVHFAG